MGKWNVADAKQRLSELLRNAAKEPQRIMSRSRPVAVVVAAESYEQFEAWQATQRERTLAESFEELRALAASDNYVLSLPERRNRKNAFAGARR